MNNKLFTFLAPLLGYIDNGRFFREPFRWLYVIFAVLKLRKECNLLEMSIG